MPKSLDGSSSEASATEVLPSVRKAGKIARASVKRISTRSSAGVHPRDSGRFPSRCSDTPSIARTPPRGFARSADRSFERGLDGRRGRRPSEKTTPGRSSSRTVRPASSSVQRAQERHQSALCVGGDEGLEDVSRTSCSSSALVRAGIRRQDPDWPLPRPGGLPAGSPLPSRSAPGPAARISAR